MFRPPTRRRKAPPIPVEQRTATEGDWLVTSDGRWEHFIPGDESSGHNLDSDCACRPSLAEDAQTHAPVLLHRSLPA